MFDIGFWEIIIIAVVALLVVGPERFPGMIKKVGYWLGQFRRIVNTVKSEVKTEVDKAEQLQQLLDEQKQILERNVNVDVTQPAVKPKSAERKQDAQSTPQEPKLTPDVPRPIETPIVRAEKEVAARENSK